MANPNPPARAKGPDGPPSSKATRPRDPWFDNARWLAGSLVVLLHASSQFISPPDGIAASPFIIWTHTALWPARLPLFAILVGYFTSLEPRPRDYSNLMRMVIAPYFIVASILTLLNALFDIGRPFRPLQSQYTLWFLVGVIFWRLFIPVIVRFRRPLAIAVAISLLSGAIQSLWVFNLHKILGLLPFVVIGVYLRINDGWLRQRTRKSIGIAIGAIGIWLVTTTFFIDLNGPNRLFLGMVGDYPDGNILGAILRLVILAGAGAAALGVLHLMPRQHIRYISYIGASGFTIYLLHGTVLTLLRHWGLLPDPVDGHWWSVPMVVLFSFALAALLGSRPVKRLARPITSPKLSWLLREDGNSMQSPAPRPQRLSRKATAPPPRRASAWQSAAQPKSG